MKYQGGLQTSNITQGRDKNYLKYYQGKAIERAKKVFGPYMSTWGYTFPEEWGNYKSNKLDIIVFKLKIVVLKLFHKLG